MSNLYRSYRRLPGSNALQPVSMLIIAFVEMNFVRPDDAIEDLGIACHERLRLCSRSGSRVAGRHSLITGDEDPALRSVEFDSVRIIARDRHSDAVRVSRFSLEFSVHVP